MTDVGAQKDELTTSRGHPGIFVQLDSLAWQGWAKMVTSGQTGRAFAGPVGQTPASQTWLGIPCERSK